MSADVASGKEMSDSFEGTSGSGKQEVKPSKKHKKSTRTRSRQEKTNRPKLTILNVILFYRGWIYPFENIEN